MAYRLGIDLGTTYTTAVAERDGRLTTIDLGTRGAAIPSVLAFVSAAGTAVDDTAAGRPVTGATADSRTGGDDGADESARDRNDVVLVGEPAERRAVTDPTTVVREFKRRFGDPTPMIVGGRSRSSEALTARLLRYVVDRAIEREGEPPDTIVLTHPANWGPYKLSLFSDVIQLAQLDHVEQIETVPEPVAAARYYHHEGRIDAGATVAVFDLGGGTFDAAVVRVDADGEPSVVGSARGLERLGGIDFDFAIVQHVLDHADISLDDLDDTDENRAGIARLREDCVAAKEALSSDTAATIPVLLPGHHTTSRLTRGEFEHMIEPSIHDAVGTIETAIGSADLTAADLDAIVLVGGSSRIPLVAQVLGSRLGRPVAVDTHPKLAVASGAALPSGTASVTRTDNPPDGRSEPTTALDGEGAAVPDTGSAETPGSAPPGTIPGPRPLGALDPTAPSSGEIASATGADRALDVDQGIGRRLAFIGAVAVVIAVIAVVVVLTRSEGSDEVATPDAAAITTVAGSQGGDDPEDPVDPTGDGGTTPTLPPDETADADADDADGADDAGAETAADTAVGGSPASGDFGRVLASGFDDAGHKRFPSDGPAAGPESRYSTRVNAFRGPVGSDGRIYTYGQGGSSSLIELIAIEAASGDLVWASGVEGVLGQILVSDSGVLLGTERGVAVVDPATGATISAFEFSSSTDDLNWKMAYDGELLVVTGSSRADAGDALYVRAVDLASGELRWEYRHDDGEPGPFEVQITNDVVIVSHEARTLAFDATTGDALWSSAEVPWSRVAVVAGGVVVVNHDFQTTRAYDARSGGLVWEQRASAVSWTATDGEAIYFVERGGTVQSLSLTDGTIRWSTAAPEGFSAALVIGPAHAVVVQAEGPAGAYDLDDGSIVWEGTVPLETNMPISAMSLVDDLLLVVQGDRILQVLG